MNKSTIYSKTAKGLREKKNAKALSSDQAKALSMIDGRLTTDDLTRSLSAKEKNGFFTALREIERLGLISIAPPEKKSDNSNIAATDFYKRINPDLPVIEVTEISGEESVQVWAEARRGARMLQETGFFAHHQKTDAPDSTTVRNPAPHVLVIEDDESIAQLLEMLLAEKGFTVQIASTIPDALATLQGEAQFDLVLLDVVLPGLSGKDGFHVLNIVRNNPQLRHLPVIMVTSQVSDEQVLQGLKAGADGYIFKPIKWESLYQCIDSVVGE